MNLLIVDSLNLSFRYKHRGVFDYADSFIRDVLSFGSSYDCGHIVVLADNKGSRFRKDLFPEYKRNREKEYTEEEQQDFQKFLAEYRNTIEKCKTKFTTFDFEGIEADDIAAMLVDKYHLLYDEIWLISSDKDWDTLIKKNVSRFSYHTRKEITYDNWNDHYDCSQEEYISIKVLMGDAGDNVPGVPGIGPKRALDLVTKYGSAYDIAHQLPIKGAQKYIKALNDFGKEGIMRNYALMDIYNTWDEIIPSDIQNTIHSEMRSYVT